MEETYMYLLYNSGFGGFAINTDFLIELFKVFPPHTDIGKTIFSSPEEKTEDYIKNLLNNIDIEYFMDYAIVNYYIINIKNNLVYYLDSYNHNLRSNQYVIKYILHRTYHKIINNNEFTPYFYNAIFKLNIEQFSILLGENNDELIELENITQDDIYSFKIKKNIKSRNRRNRGINIQNPSNNLSNIKFYKNGFKINNLYYKFNFDININFSNIYEIISKIGNGILIDFICFDDINSEYSQLSINKFKSGYKWSIDEYDGSETIILNLPYDDIITDLLNKIWNTENYKEITNLSSYLIKKEKTLSDLNNDIYK